MNNFEILSKSLILRCLLVCISFGLYSCASSPSVGILSREGAKFNRDLSRAIKTADKITIVEHSFWEDFKGTDIDVDVRTAPQYNYRSETLTADERTYFAKQVDKLSGFRKVYDHEGCMFAPHYTIHFYHDGKRTSSGEVSYLCEDFRWEVGTKHTQSKNLFKALSAIIKKTGFDPSNDWKKKASDRYRADEIKKREEEAQKELELEKLNDPNFAPTAKYVPGKEGFLVFNPFTQNRVDIEGIPSGTKIRDPQDPKSRVFKVP